MPRIGLCIPCLLVIVAGQLSGCGTGSPASCPSGGPAEPARPETVVQERKPPVIRESEPEVRPVPERSQSEPVKATTRIHPASVPNGGTVEIRVGPRRADRP
jgi:hypothetical protein